MKLDARDYALLGELDADASRTLRELGRRAGVGRDVAHYRIKRLERLGTIRSYSYVVDHSKAGQMLAEFRIAFRQETPAIATKASRFFARDSSVLSVHSRTGEFQLAVRFLAADILGVQRMQERLFSSFRQHVLGLSCRIPARLQLFSRAYLSEGVRKRRLASMEFRRMQPLITEDSKLLSMLRSNAKPGYRKLAKRLGVSPAVAHARVNRLKEAGILLTPRADIDVEKLGYRRFILAIAMQDHSAKRQVAGHVSSHPGCVSLSEAAGDMELEAVLEARSLEEFRAAENELKSHFGDSIFRTESCEITGSTTYK